ncbi:homoserine O-acetyltransferase MetX [Thalassobacillus pellis]|uniref:homoserine O-acetyltransferase MetX n=1 Tax=Thalassobacillus pellis TaxID=748008 RepID=UPI001960A8CD|nr:homoserine O-acetyltransferase [Thalassobacillus pellis]MBM7551918.1 homoserine O-acetyltransferase [Thalassobacillus pellis]
MAANQQVDRPTINKITLESFPLESGEILPEVILAYEQAGNPESPLLLICHALTGNQYAIGTDDDPGWWSELAGYGQEKAINLEQFQTICFNTIGGCHGSTGPASLHPETGRIYRCNFPTITIRDMVHAQYLALKKLGFKKAEAVIGGSLGGMQALEWGLLYPDYMKKLFVLAATPYLSDYGIAFNHIGASAIRSDPEWCGGEYSESAEMKGFAIARMTGMVTYRSEPLFQKRFGRKLNHDKHYDVQSYLDYQGDKINNRFDANSYLTLLEAMNHHDIGRGRGGWEQAAQNYLAPVYSLSFSRDLLYPYELMHPFSLCVPAGDHHHVETDYGHDGFLVQFDRWKEWLKDRLNNE